MQLSRKKNTLAGLSFVFGILSGLFYLFFLYMCQNHYFKDDYFEKGPPEFSWILISVLLVSILLSIVFGAFGFLCNSQKKIFAKIGIVMSFLVIVCLFLIPK